ADVHGFTAEVVAQNAERAYSLCKQFGGPEELFGVIYGLVHLYVVRAENDAAASSLAELRALAERLGTDAHRRLVDSIVVRSHVNAGRFAEACQIAERFDPLRHVGNHANAVRVEEYGADPLIAAATHHAYALYMTGETARARRAMKAALEATDRITS